VLLLLHHHNFVADHDMKVAIDNHHLHVMVSDKLLTQLSSDTLKQTYPRYNTDHQAVTGDDKEP